MDIRIRARIGAARLVLQETAGTASHEVVSRAQAAALSSTVATSGLNAEERANLSVVVLGLKWHGDDAASVLQTVSPPESSVAMQLKRRRVNQVYDSIVQYGTEEWWQDMTGLNSQTVKLGLVIMLAIRLGLRCPTEPTLKFLCSLWLVSGDARALQSMSAQQKHVYLQHVKAEFDVQRKLAPEPIEYLPRLPGSPIAMLTGHPLLYRHAFPEGSAEPVGPAIPLVDVLRFDQTYGCRGGSKRQCAPGLDLAVPVAPANTSIQQVADVMAAQQRMIEMLVNGGLGGRVGTQRTSQPSAFNIVYGNGANRPAFMQPEHRMVHVTDAMGQTPGPPMLGNVAPAPTGGLGLLLAPAPTGGLGNVAPAPTGGLELELASAPTGGLGTAAPPMQLASVNSGSAAVVAAGTETLAGDFLDMLSERDTERAAERKAAAKALAKATKEAKAAKEEPDEPDEPQSKNLAQSNKAKAKAKAKAVAKSIASPPGKIAGKAGVIKKVLEACCCNLQHVRRGRGCNMCSGGCDQGPRRV